MAIEAIPSLSQLTPRQQSVAIVLARQAAMREVKRRRQKQGIKGTLPFSTLSRLAIEHLQAHPELYAEALASPVVQELGVAHRKRRPRNQALRCAYLKCKMQRRERGNDRRLRWSALTASRLKANTPLSGRPVQRRSSLRRLQPY
jgi:N-acyl-D-aspartate/D-glutamate deacylase